MVLKLRTSDSNFDSSFSSLLDAKREQSSDVIASAAKIIADVVKDGDAALLNYTERFDRFRPDQLRFSDQEIEDAIKECDEDVLSALELAKARIEAYHVRQKPADDQFTDDAGVFMGSRWTAIQAVGLYVPGGTASYPSSVLMNAVPAKVAGVERCVMVVPTPDGNFNPQILAAAKIAGVDEIYRIGGAQAVAALAYGTKQIAPVSKIVGPGNAYVAAAKAAVFGKVGIDMIAGPSEVLVIADEKNNPDWIAADLLAQAEHDKSAQSILITNSEAFACEVETAVEGQLKTLPREDIARASWENYGAIILIDDFSQAVDLTNRLAPEHLEIATENADKLVDQIKNAGAIFIGAYTPEAIGDYVGGPNHVLPTARSAKFSSGLGVLDFMKRTSLLKCSSESLSKIGPAAITLGEAEGLQAHARSVSIRMNKRS